jgi:hypothetical protein
MREDIDQYGQASGIVNLQGGGAIIFSQREMMCDQRKSVGNFGEGAMVADQWRAAWGLKMEGLHVGRGRGANWLNLEHVDPHQPTQFRSLGDQELRRQSGLSIVS